MYAQQPIQNPSQAGIATGAPQQAARIVQETVMRLKDLDVRLEALNQDLAVLSDTLGNPQAAQLARTPRQFLAANIVAGQVSQGVAPHIAPGANLTGAPQTHWAAQAAPFAGQQAIAPSAFAQSPYAVAQPQGVQLPAFGANPYAVAQPNQAAQVPAFGANPYAVAQPQGAQIPAFGANPYAVAQPSQAAQVPAFAPSPFAVAQPQGAQIPAFGANPYAVAQPQGAQLQAFGANPYAVAQPNQGAHVPAFAPSPFAPETNWAAQGPAFTSNPYAAQHLSGAAATVNWAGALPPTTTAPQALSNPYANIAPGMFNRAGLVDPQQAGIGFQAAPWNVPQDPRASVGLSGFTGAPGQGIQAPFGTMNR